jgi:hypothetical protein
LEKGDKKMKVRIIFTNRELMYLQHILWHFTDYMAHDNRPDHGFGILKEYRDFNEDDKREIYVLAGRLRRLYHKLKLKSESNQTLNNEEI